MNDILNNTMCNILEALGRFKFVCISQMLPMLGKSTSYVREQLARLKSIGLIASYNLEKPIKAESMYYLTEKGKEVILDNAKVFADDIKLPIGVPLVVRDYSHRKATIDIHIALYSHLTALEISITEFVCYFDKVGNNRKAGNLESRTKIPVGDRFFMPDCIMLTGAEEQTTIYLIECFCDAAASRPLEQIYSNYIPALVEGSPGLKYGMRKNPFVLSAFEHIRIRDKVIAKLRQDGNFMAFAELFYFCTIDELKQHPATAWKDIDGNTIIFT